MTDGNTIQKFILGFLVIIVGLALIGSVASNSLAVTDKTIVYDEALDIGGARLVDDCNFSINTTYPFEVANLPTGWKASGGCAITSFSMKNQTDVAATATTDYVIFENNGTLYLKNTTKFMNVDCTITPNNTKLTYSYCPDGYMNLAWGRSIINLVAGFFALALLGAGVGLFYSVARDTGLVN